MGAVTAFVAMPIWVRYQGERFCSWLCGCGGLAETLGDRWRHLAPRGEGAKAFEKFGIVVLGLAGVTTLLILGVDVYGFLSAETFGDSTKFAKKWYGIMVDFWFASVVGVGFYPYLGNRVWCRFICPLRAYMELLSKWFGRLKIVANDKCIGCSECTRFCQMGIPVQQFAQMREDMANHNSACIQCGICVESLSDERSLCRKSGGINENRSERESGAFPLLIDEKKIMRSSPTNVASYSENSSEMSATNLHPSSTLGSNEWNSSFPTVKLVSNSKEDRYLLYKNQRLEGWAWRQMMTTFDELWYSKLKMRGMRA